MSRINFMLSCRDFPRPDLNRIYALPNLKRSKNFPKWCISFSIFSSTIWWKFHENLTKKSKVTDDFIHILCKFSWVNMKGKATLLSQLHTASFLWILINLKWQTSSFRLHQVFPISMFQMLFFKFHRPLASTQKGRKIPELSWWRKRLRVSRSGTTTNGFVNKFYLK